MKKTNERLYIYHLMPSCPQTCCHVSFSCQTVICKQTGGLIGPSCRKTHNLSGPLRTFLRLPGVFFHVGKATATLIFVWLISPVPVAFSFRWVIKYLKMRVDATPPLTSLSSFKYMQFATRAPVHGCCRKSHASTCHFLTFTFSIVEQVKESKSCHQIVMQKSKKEIHYKGDF